jgi:hypothetical protein
VIPHRRLAYWTFCDTRARTCSWLANPAAHPAPIARRQCICSACRSAPRKPLRRPRPGALPAVPMAATLARAAARASHSQVQLAAANRRRSGRAPGTVRCFCGACRSASRQPLSRPRPSNPSCLAAALARTRPRVSHSQMKLARSSLWRTRQPTLWGSNRLYATRARARGVGR